MKEYEIKITGEGTQKDIARALRALADSVQAGIEGSLIGGRLTWEDLTLCTTITEKNHD